MNSNLKFSLVIPTYNRAHLVAETLDTVFQQTYDNFEVIIVDDGSTDNTVEVVGSYGDRVQVFERDHRGCAAARNFGVQRAVGDYIIFLDSDDLWFPWSLETYAKAILDSDLPSIAAGQLLAFVDPSELHGVSAAPISVRKYAHFFEGSIDCGFFLGTGVCAINRLAFLESGGFIERDTAATDSDLLFRMGTARGFIKIDEPIVLGYRAHGQSILRNLEKVFGGAKLLIEAEKNGEYPGGDELRRNREIHVSLRARAMSLGLMRSNFPKAAFDIYFSTLRMNLSLGKWLYLLAMPAMAAIPPLRSRI